MTTDQGAGASTSGLRGQSPDHDGRTVPESGAAPQPPLIITAYGRPITQGSKVSNGARRGVRDANASTLKPWRSTMHEAVLDYMQRPGRTRLWERIDGPVRVELLFCFDRPASHYGTGSNASIVKDLAPRWPVSRGSGDIDKLARAALDSLVTGGCLLDDSQVVELFARKVWVQDGLQNGLRIPGVRITVLDRDA